MYDTLNSLFDSKLGSFFVTFSLTVGVLIGLFYKYKVFASKEYLNLHSYSKREIDQQIEKIKVEFVPERVFEIKLTSLKEQLNSMDDKQTARHTTLSNSIDKLMQHVRQMTNNI